MKLDQYVSVEMPLARVQHEGDFLQRVAAINPIPGMEFREVHTGNTIFKPGKNLVADKLVERHTTGQRSAPGRHSRSENHISLIIFEGLEEFRQRFRCILAISVKHDNYV